MMAWPELNGDDVQQTHLRPIEFWSIADFRIEDGGNFSALQEQVALFTVQHLEHRAENAHSDGRLQVLVPGFEGS